MSEQDRLLLPETPGRAQRQPISLTWRNLCYSVDVKTGKLFSRRTERKTILNQVSGVVRPGQLLAIMGSRCVWCARRVMLGRARRVMLMRVHAV